MVQGVLITEHILLSDCEINIFLKFKMQTMKKEEFGDSGDSL